MRTIPTITKNLLIINGLMFLAYFVFARTGVDLNDILGLHFFMAPDFHLYQLFTYMFMHANFTHLFFNMFALWMFGCVVENVWGPKKFLFYYISCGVGAGIIQEIAQFGSFYYMATSQLAGIGFSDLSTIAANSADFLNMWTTVGASGAIYAILLAFGMIFPNERIFIFPLPIPIKAKWFVIFYVAVELVSALSTTNDSVAHFAHLGGMLFGFLMITYWKNHPGGGNYGRSRGQQFFDNLKNNWERRSHKRDTYTRNATASDERQKDWEYNRRQQENQEEVDRILDKIRKSGYDSLTKEEKQKLFDNNR